MTLSELKACTRKELAELAKRHRVDGWHPMRKEELIKALAAATRRKKSSRTAGVVGRGKATANRQNQVSSSSSVRAHRTLGAAANAPRSSRAQKATSRSLQVRNAKSAHKPSQNTTTTANRRRIAPVEQDRLDVHVCDTHWLRAEWEVSRDMVSRAEAALRSEWHTAQPVIRLFDVTSDDSASLMKTRVRDVRIRGDVNNWFLEIDRPERTYKLHLGYLTSSGRFFVVAKSRKICTSSPGRNGQRWNGHQGRPDVIYQGLGDEAAEGAGFQGGLTGGALASPGLFKFGNDGAAGNQSQGFEFRLDAELIVSGVTLPGSELNLLGNAVKLDADGTFSVRFSLPNGRQVIPAVATSPDSTEQRTIVLAIERNTKELDPHVFDESPL